MISQSRRRNVSGQYVPKSSSTVPVQNGFGGMKEKKTIRIRQQTKIGCGARWIKAVPVLCALCAFFNIIVFHRRTDELFRITDNRILNFDAPSLRSTPRVKYIYEQSKSKWKRRRRTTPWSNREDGVPLFPFLSLNLGMDHDRNHTVVDIQGSIIPMDSVYPSFPATEHVIGDDICGQKGESTNGYNSKDRIIIAGIFSHPVASELALTLAEKCGVHHLVGLSDRLLNIEESSRLDFLMQRIPSLQLKLGTGPLGDKATEDLFEAHLPSHVFYFPSHPSNVPREDDGNSPNYFKTHSGTDQLEQICNAMTKLQSSNSVKSNGPKTILLYVTLSLPETDDTDKASMTTIFKFDRIMLGAYRIQYKLNVRELDLPNIFGPFEEGAGWLSSEEFIRSTSDFLYNEKHNHREPLKFESGSDSDGDKVIRSYNMTQSLISITDAVRSILMSGLVEHVPNQTSNLILVPTKSQTTTLRTLSQKIAHLVLNESGDKDEEKTGDRMLLPILAWNYKRYNPYHDPADFYFTPVENDKVATLGLINTRKYLLEEKKVEPTPISILERRQHDIFPCITRCASYVKCTPSIWDSVVEIARRVSEECDFLLYTANFSTTLDHLPTMKESVSDISWPRESICQLAFVSSNSTVVKNATKDYAEGRGADRRRTSEWNGEVSNNGWKLVWIDVGEDSMSQMDSLIPKILPETLLHTNVQAVFYLEPHNFDVLPALQIIWFLMDQQLTAAARTRPSKSKTDKIWSYPEQHVAVFSHTYRDTGLDQSKPDFMARAAKFILEQNGYVAAFKNEEQFQLYNNQQLQAYQNSFEWRKDNELKFELVDTPLMIYAMHNRLGQRLRCEWYEEHLFWSNEDNTGLEGLSLSYVLYRWRGQKRLFLNSAEDKWGEMIMLGDDGKALSSSGVVFKSLVDKVEDRETIEPPSGPQHFVKLHSPLNARRSYEYH